MFVLRLYMNLQTSGWSIILLSREPEIYQNVTINHLVSAGFRDWSSLMMRYSDYVPFYFQGNTLTVLCLGFSIGFNA
jgi:hypothetical protein